MKFNRNILPSYPTMSRVAQILRDKFDTLTEVWHVQEVNETIYDTYSMGMVEEAMKMISDAKTEGFDVSTAQLKINQLNKKVNGKNSAKK
jgi:hypothetical protein